MSSLILLLFCSVTLYGQTKFQGSNLELTITGTSTLHDWHMTTTSAEGIVVLTRENQSISIENAEVEFLAETLKSGKRGMDKNAYKALNTEDHPNITFSLDPITIEDGFKGILKGDLTVSGVTRKLSLDASVNIVNGQLKVSGKADFKLTDFQVEPPKALMGTIKTGNEVSIEFNTTIKTK